MYVMKVRAVILYVFPVDVSASDSGGNTSRPVSSNLEPSEQGDKVPDGVSEQKEDKKESIVEQPVIEQPASAMMKQEAVNLGERERKYTSSSESTRGQSI